jgi:hypothetical protein
MLIRSLIAAALLATAAPAFAARPADLPSGYVMVSPCVPQMGEHWANPKDMQAPIYGVYHGKVIFSEIMVPKAEFQKGFNYENLRALPGYKIDHVDIEYEAHGHPGMTFAHYDIHAYYVSHAAHTAYCPNG